MISSTLNNTVLVLQSDCKKNQMIVKNRDGAQPLHTPLNPPQSNNIDLHTVQKNKFSK